MGEWVETTIGEIAEVYDGPHATPKKTESGPWFLSISSLNGGRLDLAESAHLSEEDFIKWTRRVIPQEGDVLFSYETRLGEAALMPGGIRACLGRRMGLLRPKIDHVEPRFLLYAYLSPAFQNVIQERKVHGATVDRIPLAELPGWPICIPSLDKQQAIATVLGALDDKIAVNEQIADCSHRLALLRYSEATVGYKSVPLSSLVDPILGGTPDRKVSEYWGPGVPWASAKDVAACQYGTLITTAEEITAVAVTGSKRFRPVPKGAVLLTARGTVGAVARVCQETSLNQSCYAMLPRTVPSAVLYLTVLSAVDQMLNVAHGSVFSTLNMKSFDHLQAPALSSSELDRLESIVAPLLEQVELRLRENQSLAQLRDTLLPKLMSGELRVRDAERMVEDAT